jgi:hypothetical protein
MHHIQGCDRDQTLLLPNSGGDYIGPDNPVRFIEAFVDQLFEALFLDRVHQLVFVVFVSETHWFIWLTVSSRPCLGSLDCSFFQGVFPEKMP